MAAKPGPNASVACGEAAAREAMVRLQLVPRGLAEPRVLAAMRQVPRERFVPPEARAHAFEDRPLPIGLGQTISQPYIVALMTELTIRNDPRRVLDVGPGCGYQAAVLACIVPEVVSVEIVPELARVARTRLRDLGYANVRVLLGDGGAIAAREGPFDAIVVACAASHAPPAILAALAPGGRAVLPLGTEVQDLVVFERDLAGNLSRYSEGGVAFVPMTRAALRS